MFGFQSKSRSLDLLEWRGLPSSVDGWEWPDETGLVTFRNVPVDAQGQFFVSAFNTDTFKTPQPSVVWGNSPYETLTPAGYLFQVDPAGTDHTIARSLSNTDAFASASQSRARGGSAELSIPLGPATGKIGLTGTNTTTGPTNSGSTQSGATDTSTIKVVNGITVKATKFLNSIQSMNVVKSQSMVG